MLLRLSGEVGSASPGLNFGKLSGIRGFEPQFSLFLPGFSGLGSGWRPQRRLVSAAPSRNAIARLVNGACRVAVRSRASGCPGRCAASIADRSRSTAIRRPSVTSSIVRETSAAASMARSAMLGEGTVCGVSSSKAETPIEVHEAATFGYPPRARVLNSGSEDLLLSATGAVCERRVAASIRKCRTMNFVPTIHTSLDAPALRRIVAGSDRLTKERS